ncbi:hypothetical protein KCU73_g3657, partial [Aureobasidium melanogenum]
MQLIKSFVAKKQRLGLDFWGVVDKTGVSSTYDPFLSDIKKMIPEHLHDSKYPHHWNIERQFERVVRECLVSDYLNLEFAELFKGKSEQELDDLAASFKFENCVTRDKLTEILQADAAKCPDEINPRCQEINSTNRRLLLSDYNRHYEHEHGRYECENNSDAFKCHMCKMGFISKRLFVCHLVGSIRQEAKDLHQRSTLSISGFMHYRSLAREGLVWTIPQRYIQIKRLDKGNNRQDLSLPFPSRESLWHAFNGGEGGHHLIFFFRSSSRKGVTSTLEGRMRYVKRIVEFLHQTGRIYGHVSVVIIATEYTKAKLMPSLFDDLELEVIPIAADLPEMVYSKAMTKRLKTYATRAAAATVQLTTHILYAIMHSKNPMIVSIGANGLANNWRRFSLLMDRLSRQYGEVDVLVTMPAEEVECERGQCNSILICPEKYKGVYYGVYTSREIAEWGSGGENDAGVMVWKALQDGLQEKNDESARFWARYGGYRG